MRNNLKFDMYYILLVKTHGIWCLDCGNWNENVIRHAQREENRLNPSNKTKICTSPSDNDQVVQRIVREMNRFSR